MAKNTKDNFDYTGYAKSVMGLNDDEVGQLEFNDAQRDHIYNDAIKNVHELNLKDSRGSGKTKRLAAVRQTLNQFDGARSALGVPEEVEDFQEPYRSETFNEFLTTIHPSNRGMPVDTFLDKYADKFYGGEYAELERPYLSDLSKSDFKKRIKDELGEQIYFDEPVSEAITKLENIIQENQAVTQQDGSAGQGGVDENQDGQVMSKWDAVKQGAGMLGGFGKMLGIGTYNAGVDSVSGGLQVADAILSESPYKNVIFDRDTLEFKEVGTGLFGTGEEVVEADDPRFTEKSNLVELSELISDNLKVDVQPESFSDKVALGGGQVLSMLLGGGLATKVAGKITGATTASTLGINQGAQSGYDDYINTIAKSGQEFDPVTAREVVGFNALIGASESLPIFKALKRLTPDFKEPVGSFLKKIDDVSNNSVSRAINKFAQTNAGKTTIRGADIGVAGAIGGAEEAGQEILAEMASNLVASDIIAYDPNRDMFTADTLESGQVGGVIGAFINTLFAALPGKSRDTLRNRFIVEGSDLNYIPPDDGPSNTPPPSDGPSNTPPPSGSGQQQQQTEQGNQQQQSQPVIRNLENMVMADMNGVVGLGETEAEALADLTTRQAQQDVREVADINEDFEIETENLEGDGNQQRAVLRADNGDIVFTGENAESELIGLLENYNVENQDTVLPRGLIIDKSSDGYTLTKDGNTVTSTNLQDGLRQINESIRGQSGQSGILNVLPEKTSEPVSVPITSDGFDYVGTQEFLENNGFTTLKHFNKRTNRPVTPNGFRAYKDGLVYTVKAKKSGTNSRAVTVQIKDVDGNIYRPNENEKTQEYLVNTVLQNPVSDSPSGRSVVTTPGAVSQGGIVLRQPSKGIKTRRDQRGGENITVIDAESVDDVAKRVGGEVLLSDSYNAVIDVNGKATTFRLDDDGNINVFVGDQGRMFNGPFMVTNTGRPDEVSMGVMIKELENLDYRVVDITDNEVVLMSPDGRIKALRRDFEDRFKLDRGENDIVNIETMSDFRDAFELPPIVDPSDIESDTEVLADIREEQQEVAQDIEPDNTQMNREKQKSMEKAFDFSDELSKVQDIDGKPTFVSEHIPVESGVNDYIAPDVVFNTEYTPENVESTLENLRYADVQPTEFELSANSEIGADIGWTDDQLNGYIGLLPKHIRNLIEVHDSESNIASDRGAWGTFTPSNANNRPSIDIDGYRGRARTLHSMLSTISEEVAHFSFDSWALPELTDIYDRAYELVKGSMLVDRVTKDNPNIGLNSYIDRYNIDINDPKPVHKWILVNEFFSKQGTSIIDFREDKIDPPPGFTRQDIQDLKKSVVGNIQQITIDLTKDFDGDVDDGKQFIENILRLQAGAVIGRGVKLTYKVNREDGTPAHIEVNTTPYGSSVMTTNQTENAKRIGGIRKKLANSTGFMKQQYEFRLKYGLQSFVNTPIGRELSLEISALNRPSSSAEAKRLKTIQHQSMKVQAWLRSVGVGSIPIKDSYLDTFTRVGLTSKRQLKYAQEMDMFIKHAYTQANNNVGTIRALLRRSQDILVTMVRNHPGSEVNMASWLRDIEANIRRFSSEWDHIAYEAHQPGGEIALKKMKEAISVTDNPNKTTLDEAATKAKRKIKETRRKVESGEMNEHQGNVKIMGQEEIVRTRDRLDALREWAFEDVGHLGSARVRGRMVEIVDGLLNTNISDNFVGSSGDTTSGRVSSLQSRTLDENVSKDRLMMKFLGKIDDPLQVSISNLEQQNKVMNNIERTTVLAEKFTRDGLARPIGSTVNSEFVKSGITDVFPSDNAGLLKFIEFDPVMAEYVKSDIEMNMTVYGNALNNWVNTVRTIKLGQTVLSPRLLTSNYTSNVGNLFFGGYLAYISKFKDSATGIKHAWVDNATYGKHLRDETDSEMFIREMRENNVLQSSVGSLDAQVMNSGVIEKILKNVTGFLNDTKVLPESKKLTTDRMVNRTMELFRDLYSFGDEYAKILPYMVNREMTLQKARLTTKREDFPDGDQGQIEYEQAIVNRAAVEAADRTNRETTTWVVSHGAARNSVRNGFTFVFNDYMMHPAQMIKIIAEHSRMLVEDTRERRWAIENGHTEYAQTVQKRIVTRAIGNAVSHASAVTLWSTGIGVFGHSLFSIVNSFTEDDDEETEIKDRKALTRLEMDAALRINNASRSFWNGDPMYPISRDGYKVTYYDGKRLAALNAIFPSQPATTNSTDPLDWAKEAMGTFLNLDDETLTLRLINLATTDKDRYGREQTSEQRMDELLDLINPGMFKQGYAFTDAVHDVAFGPEVSEDEPQPTDALRDSMFSLVGVKAQTIDLRDELVKLGYTIGNQTNTSRNKVLGSMMGKLSSGDELGHSEVASMVSDMIENNNEVMGFLSYGINAYRDFGFTDREIRKYTGTNVSGDKTPIVNKGLLTSLLKGENGFDEYIISKLDRELTSTRKLKVSSEIGRENIDNRVEAIELAIELYNKQLDKISN